MQNPKKHPVPLHRPKTRLNRASAMMAAVLAGAIFHSSAGTFTTDFNSGVPPAGANIYGNAVDYDHSTGGVNNSGCLKLTINQNSQQSSMIIDDFDAGALVGSFDAQWKMRIGGGTSTPADGVSFFFGNFTDGSYGEEGPGTIEGLTIAFDIYNNGNNEAPAIDIKWNGRVVATRLFPIATLRSGTAFWNARVHVDGDGTLDVVYNNQVIYTNFPVFIPMSGRFGFGGRTGGLNENQFIDDLTITTAAPSGPYIKTLRPTGAGANAEGVVFIELVDLITQVDQQSIQLKFNGQSVSPTVTKSADTTAIRFDAPGVLPARSTNQVSLTYSDNSSPPVSNTIDFSFIVADYTVIPAEYAVGGVDKSKAGFKVRVHQLPFQLRQPGDPNLIYNAERHLALGFIDPTTGKPHLNQADLSAATDGWFVDQDIINWNQDAPTGIGNFTATSTPPYEDELIPGIPGASATPTDGIAAEILFYLDLKAGAYRFGVNSDDGFKLSTARGQPDVMGLVVGSFNGGRGAADSIFDFAVTQDGMYPFRLTWWEGQGGANVEFFMVDLATTQKIPINAPDSPIKAYRESSILPPYVSRVLPAARDGLVFANTDILVELTDGTIAVDAGSAALTLNGLEFDGLSIKIDNVTRMERNGSLSNLLPPGVNNMSLIYSYTDQGTVITVTNNWSFTVVRYTTIPAGNKVLANQINKSETGFNARVHQIDRSKDNNQGNGDRFPGDSNRMPRPEVQLIDGYIELATGNPFPNLAAPGPNLDGSYDFDFLNFNSTSGNSGIFQGTATTLPPNDAPVPGLPGTGTSNSGRDNYVMEAVTYLELKAGFYLFGVNSDDGFVVSSAPDPHDTLGTVLGFANLGRGNAGSLPQFNPADVRGNSAFAVIVPEDGVYPFRLLFWQGGGGVNVEFFSASLEDGQQALVGDTTDFPSAIPAYRTYTGPARPWVKFSVSPTPWDNLIQQSGPGPLLFKGRTPASVDATDTYNRADLVSNVNTNRHWADIGIGGVIANLGGGDVKMLLNDAPVMPTVTAAGTDTTIVYKPATPLPPGSTNKASLVYAGVTNSWTFLVQKYPTLPESLAQPATAADSNAVGFRARVKKIQNGTSGIAGNLQRAEDHLRGVLTQPDKAAPGLEPDGSYIIPGIINWNQEMRGGNNTQIGNFRTDAGKLADDPIPGIGLATTGEAANANDLISAEVLAYLDLPAGYIRMGVNSDDGFRVTAATGYDTNAPVLGYFDGGKGASDIPFSVLVTKPGLYPIRLIWFEGTGGANLEFFSYDDNGNKVPINDSSNPAAIKAYYRIKETTPPSVAIARESDGTLKITFTGKLQQTDSLTTPNWQDVAGASSPLTVTPDQAQRFYRTVSP